jgi:hypothetical protein
MGIDRMTIPARAALVAAALACVAFAQDDSTREGESWTVAPAGAYEPEDVRPEFTDIAWSLTDTTVEIILSFNEVPLRYSVYALEQPDRIVVDCFGTAIPDSISDKELPPPVVSKELALQTTEPDIAFARLVLFTRRAVAYRLFEAPTRLRLVLDWNTRLERQKAEELRRRQRRRRLVAVIAGAAVATAVTTTVIIAAAGDEESPGDDVIPPPSITPPAAP